MFRHVTTPFIKFSDYLHRRRLQAEKSLLIQVSGVNSISDISSYLTSEFGPLSSLYHYNLSAKSKYGVTSGMSSTATSAAHNHWVLAEFKKSEDFGKALESCHNAEGALPYVSSMCWFGQSNSKSKVKKHTDLKVITERLSKPVDMIDFSKAKSLNSQILVLENSLKITELGIRVRFLLAHHLEQSLSSFFPSGCVLPFGSTVSGIGRLGGDLDLVLLPEKTEIFPVQNSQANKSRLWHHTKLYTMGSSTTSRFQVQRVMETVADVMQLFIPGCSQVQRILQARVPILRFWNEYTDTQCDLCMTNSSGLYMSEIIYIMSSLDSRFVSILFAIRSWASARKITNPIPGRQPTNFMIVLLLVYFLQCEKILPTLDVLFNNPSAEDQRTTIDGMPCSFLRDPEKILTFFCPQEQNKSLAQLLYSFFQFYSEFDFATRGISLFTATTWAKPDSGPMYIQNPLERHLNVARNVSKEEISKFKGECCVALWKLETSVSASMESSNAEETILNNQFQNISLHDILLTPQLQKSNPPSQSLRMKDLLLD